MSALRDALAAAMSVSISLTLFERASSKELADAILATPAGQRIAAVIEAAEEVSERVAPNDGAAAVRLQTLEDALDALGGTS